MSSPIVETSAGVPLISMRPFAAANWSAWLVSKESPCFTGSLPSYTKSATCLTAPLPLSPYREHTKNTRVTQPSVLDILGRPNKRAGMHADGQVGSATGGQ